VKYVKGKSGNPGGRPSEKPFTDALRMELAAAGDDHRALRKIAKNVIELAQLPDREGLSAAMMIADRLDGKPAQDSTVTIEKRDATDWSLSELVALFHERRAARARDITPGGSAAELN
jgi:hypothetical protein